MMGYGVATQCQKSMIQYEGGAGAGTVGMTEVLCCA